MLKRLAEMPDKEMKRRTSFRCEIDYNIRLIKMQYAFDDFFAF